jgi:hypothetical protein
VSEIELIRRLIETKVEFVVVGGFAAITHGATRLTQDLDVCASFSEENLERLLAALSGIHPHFRAPARRPLPQRAQELAGYRNLYLETDLGDLDLLGEISGLGPYEVVRSRAVTVSLWCLPVPVLEIDALIEAKRALGRAKDLDVVQELEAVRAKLRGR